MTRWPALLLIGMAGLALLLASGSGTQTANAQTGNMAYFPLVMYNYVRQDMTIPIAITACGDDPRRGQMYRDLLEQFSAILGPIEIWANETCCPLDEVRLKGSIVGYIFKLIPTIIIRIFTLVWSVIVSAVSTLTGMAGAAQSSTASAYGISCSDDASGICFGFAAIVAIDDLAGGWISIITTLVISILTFYLGMYVVNQARNIMQPGGDS